MRLIIGLSGGVDSAVAAHVLQEQGHEVIAVFMKNWEDDDTDEGYCSTREDFISAAACAEVLGIELHHENFAQEYKERVFAYFLRELKAGRTPNPDILCNSEIKFMAFLKSAEHMAAQGIATGHYARVRHRTIHGQMSAHLYTCADTNKDQTYFLYHLFPEQLARAHFPLGDMTKPQVRALAKKIGLPSAERKDSTGICFIGERPFREFLSRYLPKEEGDIVDDKGHKIGRHQGLAFYTLGQRQGLNIGGVKGAESAPWFVAEKDLTHNRLIAVQGHHHPSLYRHEVSANDCHWLAGASAYPPLHLGERLTARVRYRQKAAACEVIGLSTHTINVRFDEPQWAVTPGQSLVLYRQMLAGNEGDGDECLGGGVIQ